MGLGSRDENQADALIWYIFENYLIVKNERRGKSTERSELDWILIWLCGLIDKVVPAIKAWLVYWL